MTCSHESKTCKHCKQTFTITHEDTQFLDKLSPTIWWNTIALPTPSLCPSCRHRRRLAFRNERKFYRRICDASNQPLISVYSPDKPYKIYDQYTRRGDGRNSFDFWKTFDFSRTFTEQFWELMLDVPRLSLIAWTSVNSEYINLAADCKNCYIIIESSNVEDSLHGYWLQRCQFCVDSSFSESCTHCYQIDNCYRSHQCFYSLNLENCNNCYACDTCINCSYCIWCSKLQNQSYCINNKQSTKEEVLEAIKKRDFPNISDVRARYPELHTRIKMSESSSWNYLLNTKNCVHCTHWYDAEDCRYGEHVWRHAKDLMDVSTVWRNAELCYECINTGIDVQKNIWCMICRRSNNLLYCDHCFNCSHLFWCIWLNNQSYCIFNIQYPKDEYIKIVSKIITHMKETHERWEFFHPSLSPYWFNETTAYDLCEITEHEAQKLWYKRSSYSPPTPTSSHIIPSEMLAKPISEIDAWLLWSAIQCTVTWKLFRIQPQELLFYKKHNIPLPQKHPDQRHIERLQLRKKA